MNTLGWILTGGLAIASTFLIDPRAGIVAWFAAAHEVPQELGDFGVLVHGGCRNAARSCGISSPR